MNIVSLYTTKVVLYVEKFRLCTTEVNLYVKKLMLYTTTAIKSNSIWLPRKLYCFSHDFISFAQKVRI